jgi:hypothetical protein
MKRRIRSFRPDPAEPGAWIVELDCGHSQHLRHDPPFSSRPWLPSEAGRRQFLGVAIDCKRCEEEGPSFSLGADPPET